MTDNYELLKDHRNRVFWANYRGERLRFYVGEHVNEGRGYILINPEDKVGAIGEDQISDIEWTDITKAELFRQKYQP